MKLYRCPICDQKIEGKYCRSCHKFVTPYEVTGDYSLNASLYESNMTEPARPEQEIPGQHTMYGSGHAAQKKPRPKSHLVAILAVAAVIAVITGLVVYQITDEPVSTVVVNTEAETAANGGYKEASKTTAAESESDDDYDEDDITELDYNEIKAAGESCNGYKHFDADGVSVRDAWLLNLEGIGFTATDDFASMDNYSYLYNGYTYTYYEMYDSYYFNDNESQGIEVMRDTVTDELISLWVGMESDEEAKQVFVEGIRALADIQGATLDMEELETKIDKLMEEFSDPEYYEHTVFGDLILYFFRGDDGYAEYLLRANREGSMVK